MQRQGGGGNDPSCGCDLQAGWPSPSELPRGGLQGGGAVNNINSFNLALVNKTGKKTRFRGYRNQNMTNNNNSNVSMMSNNNNNNTNVSMMSNNSNVSMNSMMTNNSDVSMNTNNSMNLENNMSSAEMKKVVLNGKRYFTTANGNTYTRSAKGKKGNYVGKIVRSNNGSQKINSSLPESLGLPPNLEDDFTNVKVPGGTPLSQDGGGKTRKHGKKCGCFSCIFKNLKIAGGGMPACGSCPFPGTGYCDFYARGGGCGVRTMRGGGCGCSGTVFRGGYRPTKKNLKYLKKWKRGESIGFTMTSSLKAKGLIPRNSKTHKGKRVVSKKYM
jgi:hypothetical protein